MLNRLASYFNSKKKSATALVLCAALLASSVPLVELASTKADALANPGINETQTGFSDVKDYQVMRWKEICEATFVSQNDGGSTIYWTPIENSDGVKVKKGSQYFQWKDRSEIPDRAGDNRDNNTWDSKVVAWDGRKDDAAGFQSQSFDFPDDSVARGDGKGTISIDPPSVTFAKYTVSSGSALRAVLEDHTQKNKIISFANNIDLGGGTGVAYRDNNTQIMGAWNSKNPNQEYADYFTNGSDPVWKPTRVNKDENLIIEGNGFTIYNMKMHGADETGFISQVEWGGRLIVKNLSFSNCLVTNKSPQYKANEVRDDLIVTKYEGKDFESKANEWKTKIATDGELKDSEKNDCYKAIDNVRNMTNITEIEYIQARMAFGSGEGCTGTVIGRIHGATYLENVNVTDSFIWSNSSNTGSLLGRTETDRGNVFIRNCSTQRNYVSGTDHSGGLTGCQQNTSMYYKVKYDAAFPAHPESWVMQSNDINNPSYNETVFPEMIENCFSTDCEMYSISDVGDSGGFISCGGKFIARNCFTNNIIYGRQNTGAFQGRIVTYHSQKDGLYDDNGEKRVEVYYENCYAAGMVEGTYRIGGFVGYENGYSGSGYGKNGKEMWWQTDQGEINGKTEFNRFGNMGVAVYKNCYTTAMVGMDYAGSELGGFVGAPNTSIEQRAAIIVGKNENGTSVYNGIDGDRPTKVKYGTVNHRNNYLNIQHGAVYINCYAAGEVGNILTDTNSYDSNRDSKEARKFDYTKASNPESVKALGGFLGRGGYYSYSLGESFRAYQTWIAGFDENGKPKYPDRAEQVVDVGAILEEDSFNPGTFVNCYYDKQTTGMHERACGLQDAYYSDEKNASQIPGVKGVYTLASDLKKVQGLATTAESKLKDKSLNVKMSTENNVWTYENEFYPKLKSQSDETTVDQKFGESSFVNFKDLSLYCQNRTKEKLKEKAETVKNFSNASTSTVLLNHWDQVMKMNTGSLNLSQDNNWVAGLDVNKLTNKGVDSEGYRCYEKTFNSIAEGDYEFKIQEGGEWTYSFGANGFDGSNMTLRVPMDEAKVVIQLRYKPSVVNDRKMTDYTVKAFIYDQMGNLIEEELLGTNYAAADYGKFVLAGSFGGDWNWKPDYEINGIENPYTFSSEKGSSKYILVKTFSPGSYSFKVAKGSWSTNYGVGGISGGSNMSFTLSEEAEVTFIYNADTHRTTVTCEKANVLTDVVVDALPITFKGYSVISSKDVTGYNWLETGNEDKALEKGALREVSPNCYESEWITINNTVDTAGKNFGYKIIEDGEDYGPNSYFHLRGLENDVKDCKVKFIYDTSVNPPKSSVELSADFRDVAELTEDIEISTYSVLGSEELTGYNWTEYNPEYQLNPADESLVMKQSGTNYTKVYKGVPAGTHSFKIAADASKNLLDPWASAISYGPLGGKGIDGSSNYVFETTYTSNVTIKFNSETKKIDVSTDPVDALDKQQYVLTGTEVLTGKEWEISADNNAENTMKFDENNCTHSITKKDLQAGQNYAFKVVKSGRDNTDDNIVFRLDDYTQAPYSLHVTYSPVTKVTDYKVLNKDGEEVDVSQPQISHWAVCGVKALTGSDWFNPEADINDTRTMKKNSDGKYVVTFDDVRVGTDYTNYSFKVVANGTNKTGISYGGKLNDNYCFTLKNDVETTCSIKITFDEKTKDIDVQCIGKDYITQPAEDTFEWFVCGTYLLVEDSEYIAPATVYDTIRDITEDFYFTPNSANEWALDSYRNTKDSFKPKFGESKKGFNLKYDVDGKELTGSFNEDIISLSEEAGTYWCRSYMPGKQWVKVSSGDGKKPNQLGYRSLRLIPTTYLEAGNDAKIMVTESKSKKSVITNDVEFSENSLGTDMISFEDSQGTSIANLKYKYYNFALTAGYAATDVNGIGYYGHYDTQKVINKGDSNYTERENTKNYIGGNAYDYFSMVSAYGQSSTYSDKNDEQSLELGMNSLTTQALIGNSKGVIDTDQWGNVTKNTNAQTVVKVFKKTGEDKGEEIYTKLFMDKTGKYKEYNDNYLKWIGKKQFDSSDGGKYRVSIYWSLADGRYIVDHKYVNIVAFGVSIDKTTQVEFAEMLDEEGNAPTIKYTLSPDTTANGEFSVFDILPYNGDKRLDLEANVDEGETPNDVKSKFNDKVNLQITAISAKVRDDSNTEAVLQDKKLTLWYTTDSVKLTNDNKGIAKDGTKVDDPMSGINWTSLKEFKLGDEIEITDCPKNITAFRVSGTRGGEGNLKLDIDVDVRVNGASSGDVFANNAFAYAKDDRFGDKSQSAMSNRTITHIVSRSLDGFAWYDSNQNGVMDDGEPGIQGLTAKLLYKDKASGNYKPALDGKGNEVTTTTGSDGKYEFTSFRAYSTSLGESNGYKVVFEFPSNGYVTIGGKQFVTSVLSLSYAASNAGGRKNLAKYKGDEYYIPELLPSGTGIVMNNGKDIYNGKVTDYAYHKPNQNIGFTGYGKLKIHKIDQDGNALSGVTFKLIYQDGAPVPIIKDGDVYRYFNVNALDETEKDKEYTQITEFVTDGNGDILFEDLPIGVGYQIVETKTVSGKRILEHPIDVILPLAEKTFGNVASFGPMANSPSTEYTNSEGKTNPVYYHVLCTVFNPEQFNLPDTGGGFNNWYLLLVPVVVLTALLATVTIYRAKKKYKIKK